MRDRLLFSGAALLGLVLAGCMASGNTQSDVKQAAVTGSVAYRERMALPADAVVEVRLSDVSRQDVAAPVIAETTVMPAGRQIPIPFELRYDPDKIEPKRTYALRATISSAGRMMFTTTNSYPVITRGNPTKVNPHARTSRRRPKQRIASALSDDSRFRDTWRKAGAADERIT